MSKIIDPTTIEPGRIRLVKKAEPKPPEPPKPEDVLKAIAEAVSRLGELQASTVKMIQSSKAEPAALVAVMGRVAELSAMIQQSMDNQEKAMANAVKGFVPAPAPKSRSIELVVTDRDAWGRIKSLTAKLEA